jgi:hypothetical protein
LHLAFKCIGFIFVSQNGKNKETQQTQENNGNSERFEECLSGKRNRLPAIAGVRDISSRQATKDGTQSPISPSTEIYKDLFLKRIPEMLRHCNKRERRCSIARRCHLAMISKTKSMNAKPSSQSSKKNKYGKSSIKSQKRSGEQAEPLEKTQSQV